MTGGAGSSLSLPRRLLVANRGEIAVRIIAAARYLGIETVSVTSQADRGGLPAKMADRSLCIGPSPAAKSYLCSDSLLAAATASGCDAVHPGYGFLSENAMFVEDCEQAGLMFIGPRSDTIALLGNKISARRLAAKLSIPLLPGSDRVESTQSLAEIAERIGFPLLLKAAAGGGGRGMRVVKESRHLDDAFNSAAREAEGAFGDGAIFVERFVERPRHIEIQVLGDGEGGVVHYGERDCSVQRRHQKLCEEAPSPLISEAVRTSMTECAMSLASHLQYRGAATVEFLFDPDSGEYYFLEVNTRIQVEHPVTEMVTRTDLVADQILAVANSSLPRRQENITMEGHAIECRVNAEDADRGFMPSPGVIERWSPPAGSNVRVDTYCQEGTSVPPYYDSLVAKVIVRGRDRAAAIDGMAKALDEFQITGITTTIPFHKRLMYDSEFRSGGVDTNWVDRRLAGEVE